MNSLRNRVQLIGNLGTEPEILTLDGGRKRARFSMATNEMRKNAEGEAIKETQWHQVVAWGRVAEIIEKYVNKGQEIAVQGKIQTRSWEDKEGNKKYMTEIVASDMLMLSK